MVTTLVETDTTRLEELYEAESSSRVTCAPFKHAANNTHNDAR